MADVADEAQVSRATAYRYFPSQEHLLLDAILSRSIDEIEEGMRAATAAVDVGKRVAGLVEAIEKEVAANETGFRNLARLSLAQTRAADGSTVGAIRGLRRSHWIENALAPVRNQLDDISYARLVSALAVCMGAEAHFVLRDLRGIGDNRIEHTLSWAARAILTAALAEATPR